MSHSCRLICSQHVFKMYFCASSLFFWQSETGIIGRKENLGHLRKDDSLRSWGIGATNSMFAPPRLHVILHMHITRLTPAVPQETKHSIIIYSAAPHYRWVHVFPLMWNDLLMTPWWLLIVECHSFLEHAWYFPLVFRFYFLHIC